MTKDEILKYARLIREEMELDYIRTSDLKKAKEVWKRMVEIFTKEIDDLLKANEKES